MRKRHYLHSGEERTACGKITYMEGLRRYSQKAGQAVRTIVADDWKYVTCTACRHTILNPFKRISVRSLPEASVKEKLRVCG